MTEAANLSALNTLGLAARADRIVVVRHVQQLFELIATWRGGAEPVHFLGGGSNVVLRRQVPGTMVVMRTRGVRWERGSDGLIRVSVAAGERWHDLVRYSLGQGWSGLENLALIPGSVGAAPIQNIGAYGVELADRFVSLRALDIRDGRVRTFDRDSCEFGYRHSRFKAVDPGRYVILEVTLGLREIPQRVIDYPDLRLELQQMGCGDPTPQRIAEAVIRIRRRKLPDPRFVGNAGSFFKNPVVSLAQARRIVCRHPELNVRDNADGTAKMSAAQLIDGCGWKGRTIGNVGVWRRQPLVLINTGGATALEVLQAADAIRRDVAARYGVDLEMEPQVLGQD